MLAAQATASAEREKLDREQLQVLVTPRRLGIDQQVKIGQDCQGRTGKTIVVSSYALDGEGTALASQIIAALTGSGMTVIPKLGAYAVTGEFDFGISIQTPPEGMEFSNCLQYAFLNIGGLEASVNGPLHVPSSIVEGNEFRFGGSGGLTTTHVRAGSPIFVLVGAKPLVLLPEKGK